MTNFQAIQRPDLFPLPPQGDDEGVVAASAASVVAPVGTTAEAGAAGESTTSAKKVNLDAYGTKEVRTSKRLKKMKEYECAICMVPLCAQPENVAKPVIVEVFKTPCNHKFHKACLVVWMDKTHKCPLCRSELPAY